MSQPEKKTKTVTLRYRPTDLEKLDRAAASVGLSRSAYIARKLQGLPIQPSRTPQVNWQTYAELGEIARSLQNLANALNQQASTFPDAQQPLTSALPGEEILTQMQARIERTQTLIKQLRLELCGVKNKP
jgi:HPt (histidine-containing phosphotransfer) domain-containing protein